MSISSLYSHLYAAKSNYSETSIKRFRRWGGAENLWSWVPLERPQLVQPLSSSQHFMEP
jgi:hypothetical protein